MKITAEFIASLKLSVERLIEIIVEQAEKIIGLIAERDELNEQLRHKNQQVVQLEEKLQAAQQRACRQAAPFRIADQRRSRAPRRPGRPKGHRGSYRPKPKQIDQHFTAPLTQCPHCQGPVQQLRDVQQYLQEIPPVQPTNIQLTTQEGYCPGCDLTVRSSHPLQVSLAEGAAGVQLGPNAVAIAIELNKVKGLSLRKTCATLKDLFGLQLSPGGLSQALARVGKKLEGTYQQRIADLRAASVVHADETSWWVGGPGYWLWTFTNATTTVYVVDASRGRDVVQRVVGSDYPGVLVSDCLSPYDDATPHQHKCYSHHLKAISEAMEAHPEHGAGYLEQLRDLLHTAMLFKALDADPMTARYQRCVQSLEERAQQCLSTPRSQPQEERIRKRLWKQRDHLFTFLKHKEVDATNNLAERQLRPAVIARKLLCGNKTPKGARTWEILTSIAVTAAQAHANFSEIIRAAVRLPPAGGP
jgi:transposase